MMRPHPEPPRDAATQARPGAASAASAALLQIRWAHVLPALVIATRCGRWAYRWFDRPQQYPEPIVGHLAWNAARKGADYAAPLAVVAGFVLAFAIASALSSRIARRLGTTVGAAFDGLLLVTTAPAAVWAAGLLTTPELSFALVNVSVGGVALTLAFGALLTARDAGVWTGDVPRSCSILRGALLVAPAAWLAVHAVAVGASRAIAVAHGRALAPPGVVGTAAAIAAAVSALGVGALLLLGRTLGGIDRGLRMTLVALQLAFPLFFLALVPAPWEIGGRIVIGYPVRSWAWVAVGVLVAFAYVELGRRSRAVRDGGSADPFAIFTVMSIVAGLLFLKSTPVGLPQVSPDDYHFGELLLPWWSLAQKHLLPFADYSPARGLVNYFPGAAASIFLDGTAASVNAAWPFVYVGVLLVAVPALCSAMSAGWAALALALALPANGMAEIDILVSAFIALACGRAASWTPSRWFVVWVLSGTALVLVAPGQGGLAVIATSPIGAWVAARGLSRERAVFVRTVLAAAALAMVAALVTPLGRMIVGAVRYGAEQSAVNSVAHGIPWKASFGTSSFNAWLYEAVRASWLLVAIWAGILVLAAIRTRRAGGTAPYLPHSIAVFIVTTLFVFRAAGRIDIGPTRLDLASVWAFSLLLPLVLFPSTPPSRRGAALLAWATLAGLVLPHFAGIPTKWAQNVEPVWGAPAALVEEPAAGLAKLRLGAAVEPANLARYTAARVFLDRVLDTGETYLDLTNHHAHYFYLDRRPPIETGSVYNLVTEAQQQRAIDSLRASPPPAVLVSADNIVHDGGPIGLRSPLLYRHVMLSRGYEVVVAANQTWLLRADRVDRLSRDPAIPHEVHPLDDAVDDPLVRALLEQDLRAIPASWGASSATLEPAMHVVRRLQAGASPAPARFDLSTPRLAGADGGILAFDFRCEREAGAQPVLVVRWKTEGDAENQGTAVRFEGRDGRLLVPVDASPTWLLAPAIRSLRIELADPAACRHTRVENVRLLQRHGATAAR